ncbi:TolC family protein [Pedobacter cryophilus]|uniref:TolC family protein n=1 Tax=Pedobacter cryophilus TaxID=2571271 RepID=A0A4U1C223_9SPHI|nr:TolC family protein [Pedobacter cryophilus]TKB99057.1 TolC family protein [Pedobacter cryophilus]
MKTKTMLITAMLSLTIGSVMAQQETAKNNYFNLNDCINYAYEHQTNILNADLDRKIADAKVKQTIGIGLPQVNASADFQDYLKRPIVLFPDFVGPAIYNIIQDEDIRDANGNTIVQPNGVGGLQPVNFQQKYNSNVGLSVSQLLFDGSYIVGLQASKTYKELSQRLYTRSRIETNVAVTKAFYMVLVNNEQVELLNTNIEQLKKQLDQTKALYDNGFAEKIDADRLTVLYNNLNTEKQNILRSLELGVGLLKFQMGMPVEEQLALNGKISEIKFDKIEILNDTAAYNNRIEYSLAQTQLKLNALDLKRYKSQYLPSLAAFGNGSYQFQSNSFGELYNKSYPTVLIGLKLNVPIFSGGQRMHQVRQAEYTVQKSTNDLKNAKNSINLDIRNSITNYTNSITSLENQQRNLDLANEILRVSKIKYEQGVGSSIEVTQAQTSLKEAENNYINALYQALTSKVDTEKATGVIK